MKTEQKGKKWYVIRTNVGQEYNAKKTIEALIDKNNLEEYVDTILIPKIKVVDQRNGKTVMKEKRYMPGYVLIEMDIDSRAYGMIGGLKVVSGFVSKKPLSDEEVKQMLGHEEELEEDKPVINFDVGNTVMIVDGPFKNFKGPVTDIRQDVGKVTVNIDILGRTTPVELSFSEVMANWNER